MARFNMENADHYGTSGGTNYFSLKNDKDTARVRFMYNTMEDVEGVAVHQIEIGDRKRYVNCLREYGSPVDSCPLCAARYVQKAKLFIPLYDEETDSIKVWERGKKFFAKLSSICSRYVNSETDLVNHVFEIERNGKAGDQQTTYEIYEVDRDRIFALTIDPMQLIEIRKRRLDKFKRIPTTIEYAGDARILDELDFADKIIRRIGCRTIDVTQRAIEDTALIIIKTLTKEKKI